MNRLNQYPTPISGLTLGLAGIAAFWSVFITSTNVTHFFLAAIALLVILLLAPLLLKFVLNPRTLLEDLKHPTVGSVVPTIAMTLMLLSHTLSLLSVTAASILWMSAVVLHAAFFSLFCFHRVCDFDLNHLVPSWFVPPIGIVVACLTVPTPYFMLIAHILLVFGLVAYAVLLPAVIYRLSLGGNIENARKPTLAILAAPASLTLAGYLSLSTAPNALLVVALFTIAVLMTLTVYIMLTHLLRLPFSPAYSAFTFPLAISATAMFKMSVWSHSVTLFSNYSHLFYLSAIAEGVIASIVILYVLQHYLRFLVR